MHKYGTTREQLADVAVKNHEHGYKNPNAQFRMKLTRDSVTTNLDDQTVQIEPDQAKLQRLRRNLEILQQRYTTPTCQSQMEQPCSVPTAYGLRVS